MVQLQTFKIGVHKQPDKLPGELMQLSEAEGAEVVVERVVLQFFVNREEEGLAVARRGLATRVEV